MLFCRRLEEAFFQPDELVHCNWMLYFSLNTLSLQRNLFSVAVENSVENSALNTVCGYVCGLMALWFSY